MNDYELINRIIMLGIAICLIAYIIGMNNIDKNYR